MKDYFDLKIRDEEVYQAASNMVKSKQNKFFNKHQVTQNLKIVVPRWASDDELITLIEVQQKKINPDAIFGVIDPRDSNNVKLTEMFTTSNYQ